MDKSKVIKRILIVVLTLALAIPPLIHYGFILLCEVVVWWERDSAWGRSPYRKEVIIGSTYDEIVEEYGEPHLSGCGNHDWHNISEEHTYIAYAVDYRGDHRAVDDFWHLCIHFDEDGVAYFASMEWSPGGIARRDS